MPRSKRNKQVELAKTKKRGLEWKKNLFEQVRSCVDSYKNVFIFSVNDMRNSKMKEVREQWKHSRFFIGKNKIMAMALGRSTEEEYKPNLHKIGQQIKGPCGLLFSNKSIEEVLNSFRSHSEGVYARSGNTATEAVKLEAGPLPMFPHSLEPYLRQLGLPTSLEKGVVHLVKEHEVCKEGDILTPENAKILELLGYEMGEFHITINCVWSEGGDFMQFTEMAETSSKENSKKKKSNSVQSEDISNSPNTEEMEVEEIHDSSLKSDDEYFNKENEKNVLPANITDHGVKYSSTPKEKSVGFKENIEESTILMKEDSKILEENILMQESNKNHEQNTVLSTEKNHTAKNEERQHIINASTPKDRTIKFKENSKNLEESTILITEKDTSSGNGEKKKNEISSDKEEDMPDNRKNPRRKRKIKAVVKNDSVEKAKDVANSSQESPVFRELRNRSVKVSRKKKA